MRTRLASVFVVLVVAASLNAEKLVIKFQFAGTDAGQNVFERKADGSFSSVTTINIMGTKIDSKLTGKFSGKRLASFTLDQTVSGRKGKVTYGNGKYTAEAGGQKSNGKLQFKTTAYFSNYHPQLVGTMAAALDPNQAGAQKVETLVIDSLVVDKMGVTVKSGGKAVHDGKPVPLRMLKLDAGPVALDFPLDPDNRVLGMDVPVQKFQGIAEGYADVFVDPVAKYPELSQPTYAATKKLAAVKVPMRDGVKLVADVVMPAEEGKYPVILSRTPYGRDGGLVGADWWAKRGYVVVSQDVRGRHDSEGKWDPFLPERQDGYDTIDWVSKQPWCDGNIGMIGGSYVGLVQWAAAVEGHPALKCIVPQVSPPDAFFNIPYDHGCFMLWGSLWWSNIVKDKVSNMSLAMAAMKNVDKIKILPLSKIDNAVLGRNIPWFDAWLKKDRPSAFKGFDWGPDLHKVGIPALHISGWWDGDGIGTKLNWAAMQKAGRTNQWLIYGPWTHAFNTASKLGDVDYGETAIMELDSVYLRWFDTWLKGKDVGLDKVSKVKVFVTGKNEWRELQGWPDARSKPMTMYFGVSSGSATGAKSTGRLISTPSSAKPTSRYDYDPSKVEIPKEMRGNPMDTESASTVVKLDPKQKDVLVYKSDAMKAPLEIGGPISVDLFFSTSAKDTDFFAILVDVNPKGVMRAIGQPGKIRAMYISGWETPKLLTPGKTYRTTIDLWDTAHQFKKGHRVGVVITSQQFPVYARNLNTGEPLFSATRMVTAKQTIYHDKSRPSALRFYVLPPKN